MSSQRRIALNLWVGYFPTVQLAWNEVTAGPLPDETDMATVTDMQHKGTIPDHGALVPVDIPSDASHFKHRTELVYLPPAWFASNPPPKLPTVMMIAGEFNTPSDWPRTGNAIATIDSFAAAHGGNTPVFVFVDVGGSFNNDTECVNGPRGNVADHLTEDIPPYLVSVFGVSTDSANWGVVGWSMGGTCAVDLTVMHPELFSTFVDIAGDTGPNAGTKDQTIGRIFGGDAAAWAAYDPTTVINKHGPYHGVSGWFAISTDAPTQRRGAGAAIRMRSDSAGRTPRATPVTRPRQRTRCARWAAPTASAVQSSVRRESTTGRSPPMCSPRRCRGWPVSSAPPGCHAYRYQVQACPGAIQRCRCPRTETRSVGGIRIMDKMTARRRRGEEGESRMTDGPLIVQSDKTVLLEVDHEQAAAARAAIAPFAELERAPEHIHTYRITPLALWNARAAGHDAEQVVDALVSFSRYAVPQPLLVDIVDTMARYGRLQLVKSPVHGLTLVSLDRAVLEEVLRNKKIAPMLGARIDDDTVIVHNSERGRVKQMLLKIGWPAEDLAGYVDGEKHPISLDQENWHLRDYQEMAADSFWEGGSGVVVLPCGAGKTLVGAAAMAKAGATTLILVTNTVAGRQWKRELINRTSLTEDEIGEYSGEKKEIRPVTIATYQVITRRTKGEYRHLELFDSRDWGLIIYDEVHLLPAPVFRMTADLQSRRRLGLTATLIREDGREGDVFCLIGPKRYDAPWKDIEAQGWIAPAECIEVRVTMTDNERMLYAIAEPDERYKLCSTVHSKIAVVKSILERHPGDQTLVIGAYLDQLDELGEELNAPVIQGSTKTAEREALFDAFRKRRDPDPGGVKGRQLLHRSAGSQCGGAGFGDVRVATGRGAAAGQAVAAEGRRRWGDLLLGGVPRQPGRRVRRTPPAVPCRAGLRLCDQGRRRPVGPRDLDVWSNGFRDGQQHRRVLQRVQAVS